MPFPSARPIAIACTLPRSLQSALRHRSLLACALGIGALAGCDAAPPAVVRIHVDPARQYQTMTGWEATAQAGQWSPLYPAFRDTLLTLAVDELGINRLRLEVRSGVEHTRDYFAEGNAGRLSGDAFRCARYETQNDNDDPAVLNPAGFRFSEFDHTIEQLVLPMDSLLRVRGRKLVLSVNYVAFMRQCPTNARYDHRNAAEYAEFVLAVVLHMRDRFHRVPDLWEVILEPDNTNDWSGPAIGQAIVEADRRLREAGVVLRFVAPSNTSMAGALRYYNVLREVPGVRPLLAELAYHRYRDVSTDVLRRIGERTHTDGIRTAMLEHIGSGVDDLLDDLLIGNVSAWSQYGLAIDTSDPDDGGLYYRVDTSVPSRPVVREGKRTRFLRQLFAVAELGAVRIDATTDEARTRPVAFRNLDGRLAVAVRAMRATQLQLTGLSTGTYRVSFATDSIAYGSMSDVQVTSGQPVRLAIPAAGVLALVARKP